MFIDEIDTKSDKYRTRFIAHFTGKGVDLEMAESEYDACREQDVFGRASNPEDDADECMSYWDD